MKELLLRYPAPALSCAGHMHYTKSKPNETALDGAP